MFPASRSVLAALASGVALGISLPRVARAQEAARELGRPILHSYTPGTYLGGYLCQAVTQDANGVIYVGNVLMIRVFDGRAWSGIPLPVESGGVREFATGADGRIYAGGPSLIGYLSGSGRTAKFVSLADRLPPEGRNIDEIRHVAVVGDAVCFSDEEKLLIWRDGHFTIVPCPAPADSHGARLHAVGNELLVSRLGHALCRLVDDRLEPVADDPVLRENQIISIEPGREAGTLVLLSAERGFFQLGADRRVAPLDTPANRWLVGRRVFRALRLADGSRAIVFSAASGEGGLRLAADGSYLGPLDLSIGLVVQALHALYADREGGLWLGEQFGLARLEWPSAATLFDVVNGLGEGAVNDVVRHHGTLYAATDEGLFRLRAADADGRSAAFERVLRRPIHALLSHPSGLLVLGDSEVFAVTPAGIATVAHVPGGGGTLVRSKADPARVWVSTAEGIRALRVSEGGWQDDGNISGFAENCTQLAEAGDGVLWATTLDGALCRIEAASDRVTRFTGGDGLPAKFKRVRIAEWGGEPVFSIDGGARPFRFDPARQRFQALGNADSFPREPAESGWLLSEAPQAGHAWLAGAATIAQVRPDASPRRLPNFVAAAAGRVRRLWEESSDTGAVLWIGSERGLVRVEVARAFVQPVPFATLLTAKGVGPDEHLEPEHAPITFDYVSPRQQPASAVVYQTRLFGRETAWTPWSADGTRSFPHLPPGSYRFEVRARDADGEIATPASMAFVILPPWWRTWWALAGYAGAGAAVLTGAVQLRTRALRQRAARLEQIVAARTRELAEKNVELTRLHRLELDEKISARLGEEKARLEVLRYQLNPHFLFNALATIAGLTVRDPKAARGVIRQLAEFCRLTLTRGRHEFVTLAEEFQMLAGYLQVVRAGAQEPPEVSFDLDPTAAAEKIPAFLLLPLVENASKYGRRSTTGAFQIAVSARREPSTSALAIEVANTGTWIDDLADRGDIPSTRIGLENIRQRLARSCPDAHTFTTEARDGWVRVSIRLSSSAFAETATAAVSRPATGQL